MAETFSVILTTLGLAEVADAIANSTPVVLNEFSVGDSNSSYYEPSEGQTSLVNEQYRAALTSIGQDPTNSNWIVAEGTIPADGVGGWEVREAGIWSSTGNLFAIGKFPATYKPLLSSGAGKDLIIKSIFEVTNVSAVTLLVDPNVAIATTGYVDSRFAYIVEGFNDFVVCNDMSNPLGNSGNSSNPFGVDRTEVKPHTGIERIWVYAREKKSDGRVITQDSRVTLTGRGSGGVNKGAALRSVFLVGRYSPRIPKSLWGKEIVVITELNICYCTFFGTGINILLGGYNYNDAFAFQYSVDGEGWINVTYDPSGLDLTKEDLTGIAFATASGLSERTHTVRFRVKATSVVFSLIVLGFDFLSNVDAIFIQAGDYFINGKTYTRTVPDTALTPTAIGANNSRRDLIVVGEDLVTQLVAGTVINTPQYYGDSGFDTQRNKEEILNQHNIKDFLIFHTSPGGVAQEMIAHTLGDNTTNFHASPEITQDLSTGLNVSIFDTSAYIEGDPYTLSDDIDFVFVFVGTGADIGLQIHDNSETNINIKLYVDEVLKGTLTEADAAFDRILVKACTGLPHGSHTIRLEARNTSPDDATGAWQIQINNLIVYSATTPDVPSNHLALGCVTLTPTDGWIAYAADRRVVYIGGLWITKRTPDTQEITKRYFGYEMQTEDGDSTNMTAEFIFAGIGIEWMTESGNDDAKVMIFLDDTVLTTSHPDWSSLTVFTDCPAGFDNSTGIVDTYETGDQLVSARTGMRITGLTAGGHTIKLVGAGKNASSSNYNINVHGFKILPLALQLDIEQNWNEDFNNVARNCSPVDKDHSIVDLEKGKQDTHIALSQVIDETIIESGTVVDTMVGHGGSNFTNPERYNTVHFRTTKISAPVVIIVDDSALTPGANYVTVLHQAYINGFVTHTDSAVDDVWPGMEITYTAIAQ